MAARRTDAATRARREASAAIERRLLAATDVFIARGDLDPPALRLVAEAKVSKTFWYDHPEVRDKVEERFADAREHRVEEAAHGAVVTIASLKSENDTLQAIVTRKDQVIAKLERRVGELMGDQKRPALPEEREVDARIDELERELAKLKHNNARLREQNLELETSLDAARELNRRDLHVVHGGRDGA